MKRLANKRLAGLAVVFLLLAAGGLYGLDRYNIPSWMITQYHHYAKKVHITLNPVVITDRMVLEQVAASGIAPQGVADAVAAGQLDAAWERYRAWRAENSGVRYAPDPEQNGVVQYAQDLAEGKFYVFGKGPYQLGDDFTWTEFPPGKGDVVYEWEINALRHFAPLAQAYLITGEDRFKEAISGQLASWQRENPIDNSVAWRAPMEASLRLSTFVWVTRALAPRIDGAMHAELVKAMYGHAAFIARYIDAPRKINNHAIFAAIGLYLFAAEYPEFPESAGWLAQAEQRLLDELASQYTGAGVHKEKASFYHKALTDIYLHYLIAKLRRGEPVPPEVTEQIAGQVRFVRDVSAPDSRPFAIGDSSDPRFLELGRGSLDHGASTLFLAALVMTRPEFSAPTEISVRTAKWALGEPLFTTLSDKLKQAPPVAAPAPLSVWPESGFFRIDSDRAILFGDLGPIGGAPHLAGHDHADTTSFVFWRDGKPVVVDPGTYTYRREVKSNGTVWRDHMRSTFAHNAVTVDGLSQAEPAPGGFGYLQRPDARLLFAGSEGGLFAVGGEHSAYRERVGATRRIFVMREGDLLVVDWFPDSTGRHEYLTTLNLPALQESRQKTFRRLSKKNRLSPAKVLWSTQEFGGTGEKATVKWFTEGVSRSYGTLETLPVMRRRTTRDGPVAQAFSLVRKPEDSSGPRVTALAGGGFAVTALLNGQPVTVLLAGGEGQTEFEGWATDADVAVFEAVPGGRALRFDGTAVRAPEGTTPLRVKGLPRLNPNGPSTDKETGDQ